MKKEPKAGHNIFANSDLYRKENVQGAHVIASKSNIAFNRNNNNQYQNQAKLKGNNGAGQVIGIQEGYFPPGFYAGKHPSVPHNMHHQANEQMFTKHELEFHQKSMAQQQQFPPQFHTQKFDMHEFEHHNNLLKSDVNHKMIASGIHGRGDFPQNQLFYNENNAQNQNSHHNQYYPNEFDLPGNGGGGGGGNETTNSSGYFDPKSQAHYYDMNYHHHGNDYSEMYGPNAVVNENCENFASFQQYYDHHQQQQQQQQQHTSTQQQQNMHHPNYHSHAAAAQQNMPPGAYIHHQQQHQQNFPPHHNSSINAQIHGNANLTENSNSSSDFNFLSNLNDFAPEYYQLS
jgi:hypothetical protein